MAKNLGSPTLFASKTNNARIASPVEYHIAEHAALPSFHRTKHLLSTSHFLPSRRTKHERHLRLDLAPAVAPSTQHARFPFKPDYRTFSAYIAERACRRLDYFHSFLPHLLTLVRSVLVSIASAPPYKYLAPGLAGKPSKGNCGPFSPFLSLACVTLLSFVRSAQTASLATDYRTIVRDCAYPIRKNLP